MLRKLNNLIEYKRLRRQVKHAEDDLNQARQKQSSKAGKTTGRHQLKAGRILD